MSAQPREILLHLTPSARFDLIDVAASVRAQHGDVFTTYGQTLCCSFHTTAGYLDQPFCAALGYRGTFAIPTQTAHAIDAFNLRDPQYGLFVHLHHLIEVSGIEHGRIDIRLAPRERHVGLTVNEYETMLMRNDLPDVLRDPLR